MIDDRRAAPVRPTPERMAKGDVIKNTEVRGERPKPWWTFESIHDGLLANGLITEQGWREADKFKRAWATVHGSGCASGSLEPRVDGARRDISEAQRIANQDLNRWSKLLAPGIYRCMVAVVGVGQPPTTWADKAGLHPAAARLFVCTSIEQFALISGANR